MLSIIGSLWRYRRWPAQSLSEQRTPGQVGATAHSMLAGAGLGVGVTGHRSEGRCEWLEAVLRGGRQGDGRLPVRLALAFRAGSKRLVEGPPNQPLCRRTGQPFHATTAGKGVEGPLQERTRVCDTWLPSVREKIQAELGYRMQSSSDPGADFDVEARWIEAFASNPLVVLRARWLCRPSRKNGKPTKSRLVPDPSLR